LLVAAEELGKNGLRDGANEVEVGRLNAVEASHSGAWLHAPPDKNCGLRFSNAEMRSRVSRRLGREICEEAPCPMCLGVMDRWGIHPECCTAGGDKTAGHNLVRNHLHRQAKIANFGSRLEQGGVERVLGLGGRESDRREEDRGRERPADVLMVRAADVRTGAAGRVDGHIALDVGIVCPQANTHRLKHMSAPNVAVAIWSKGVQGL